MRKELNITMEKSDNVIVIKSNLCLSAKGLAALRNSFLQQQKEGVVVVPYYCDVIVAPDNSDLVIMEEGEMMKGD